MSGSSDSKSARSVRIATRGSALALWQAQHVADRLRGSSGCDVELVHVSTAGDRDSAAPLANFGGVGVFTREIQNAVLDGRADVAVHSLKDLPTEPVPGMVLSAVPARASAFDALVMRAAASSGVCGGIARLPTGARIGTGSLRRRAQLLHQRPDLVFVEIRGNVDTRLRKLDEGQCDALILAEAGLDRLGFSARITARLSPPQMYPAVGQGALGLECRAEDAATRELIEGLTDPGTFAAVRAERRVLNELRGGCHTPLGAFTSVDGDRLVLEVVVLSLDGRHRRSARAEGSTHDGDAVGRAAAADLVRQGALDLMAAAK